MRAVVVEEFGGPEVLKVVERDDPEPIPTEVLVRVHAAGVNPVDFKTRTRPGLFSQPGFIPGWDVSGTVEAVGGGVTRFSVGDEVYGMPWFPREAGAYAELVTAPSRQFAKKPVRADHVTAGAMPLAALTAWQALIDTADVIDSQAVLVHAAAGGVGHMATQIAKSVGCHVYGTARAEKHDFLRAHGVDEPIDYENEKWEERARGVDVVLDLVGTTEYGLRSLDALQEGGLLIQVPSGADASVAEAARERGIRSTGILVEPDGHALELIAELYDERELEVEIAETFPLEEAAQAHGMAESGRTRGKIVLVP